MLLIIILQHIFHPRAMNGNSNPVLCKYKVFRTVSLYRVSRLKNIINVHFSLWIFLRVSGITTIDTSNYVKSKKLHWMYCYYFYIIYRHTFSLHASPYTIASVILNMSPFLPLINGRVIKFMCILLETRKWILYLINPRTKRKIFHTLCIFYKRITEKGYNIEHVKFQRIITISCNFLLLTLQSNVAATRRQELQRNIKGNDPQIIACKTKNCSSSDTHLVNRFSSAC